MKSISTNNKFAEFCTEIGEYRQKFFKHTLTSLITFKVFLGRKLSGSPFYGQYGAEFFPKVAQATGISESSLKDSVELVEVAKLSSKSAADSFIKSFPENYSSYNDMKRKLLGRKGGEEIDTDGKCRHCPLHCK